MSSFFEGFIIMEGIGVGRAGFVFRMLSVVELVRVVQGLGFRVVPLFRAMADSLENCVLSPATEV